MHEMKTMCVCVIVCARDVLLIESPRRIKSKYGVNLIFLFLKHVQQNEIIVTKKKKKEQIVLHTHE